MRTLDEILEAAKSGGERPTHDECYWAMLACEAMWHWMQRHYQEALFGTKPRSDAAVKLRCEADFQMAKRALAADPKHWLGPDRDWSKPENRERRAASIKLYEKALAGQLPNQKARARKDEA